MNIYAIELNGCDGISDVIFVAGNDREEAVKVVQETRNIVWYDVMWIEGATYETDKPCEITARLCTDKGEMI